MSDWYRCIVTSRKRKIKKIQDGITRWYNCTMVTNITKNGVPFRDHTWIKDSPKRTGFAKSGDILEFTARETEYDGKKGLRHIRAVRRISIDKYREGLYDNTAG